MKCYNSDTAAIHRSIKCICIQVAANEFSRFEVGRFFSDNIQIQLAARDLISYAKLLTA